MSKRPPNRPLIRFLDLTPAESPGLPPTGVHPVVIKVALSAAAWFIAVTWLNFAAGIEVDFDLAVVTGFFVMFFTLFLLTASLVIKDPRWKQRNTSFTEFLKDQVAIDTYTMRGSDVLDSHLHAAGDPRRWRNGAWFDLVDRPFRLLIESRSPPAGIFGVIHASSSHPEDES